MAQEPAPQASESQPTRSGSAGSESGRALPGAAAPRDRHGRPLRNLRLSVTDRCNLRCSYCMPGDDYTWLPRSDILRFEEIQALTAAFVDLGVDRVRLTGGEPLLRRGLGDLVALLAGEPRLRDIALTTNGVHLEDQAAELRRAGLHRITVSLDTLRPERFEQLTRSRVLPRVLAGIEAARAAGFTGSKLDTVVMAGINDDELVDLVEFGRRVDFEVRFIEYMDVGGATSWSMQDVVSRAEILRRLTEHYGPITPAEKASSAPADRFHLSDGTVFGIISSTTAPFCAACDRSRLTADGVWYQCLYARDGLDLRTPLRNGADRDELRQLLAGSWRQRSERGAEDRLQLSQRGASARADALRADPHLEMHTRGG